MELMARTFGQQPASYSGTEQRTTRVTMFFQKRPVWSPARRKALQEQLNQFERLGLKVSPARISFSKLVRQDWAETWKRHFHPIAIQSRLLIKPSWSRRRAAKNQATVTLDPGLSFGTGQHPTTRFCLEQIAGWRQLSVAQSFLDIGTGSGILAIAAAKLGFCPVDALDCDLDAIHAARANIGSNRVSHRISLWENDLSSLGRSLKQRYSLICANLISNLLLKEIEPILTRLDQNGLLVLAGILKPEFERVRQIYAKQGVHLVASRTEAEWRSGAFRWALGSRGSIPKLLKHSMLG